MYVCVCLRECMYVLVMYVCAFVHVRAERIPYFRKSRQPGFT